MGGVEKINKEEQDSSKDVPGLQNSAIELEIGKINRELERVLPKAGLLSYGLLSLALVGAIIYPFVVSSIREAAIFGLFNPAYIIVPMLPIGVFFYFRKKSREAKYHLEDEFRKEDLSEPEITRIIDKYSGAADGIGTALPLFGAAILLGVVALGDPNNPSNDSYIQMWFMNLAVPFEVVSIVILAAAKLYEAVFDELSLCYQQRVDDLRLNSKNKYQSDIIKAIDSINTNVIVKVENALTPDQYEKLKDLLDLMHKVVNGLKDSNVSDNLKNLIKLSGK